MSKTNIEWWQTWTPNLAYVLGFAFADGVIGRINNELILTQSGKEILEKIAVSVPGAKRLSYSPGAKCWRLRFREKGLRKILLENGIVPNKTVHGYWSPNIPDALVPHYMRGYFDGDGSISKRILRDHYSYKVGFVCHKSTYLDRLATEFHKRGTSLKRIEVDGNNYRLRYTNRADVSCVYQILYTDADLYLERKLAIFKEALTYYSSSQGHKGSWHGNAKITENDVREIRKLRRSGWRLREIAGLYHISLSAISGIVLYKSWRHVE